MTCNFEGVDYPVGTIICKDGERAICHSDGQFHGTAEPCQGDEANRVGSPDAAPADRAE